ncbi:Transcription factor TYE7 [Nakaseomyces bracarensis]|uniref:Transcription factor TYE7 n=1 Tax=Nakaseomyces bracarensis TaxID=273131 RepID=A0ABR4NM80_9SACH
MELIGSNLFTEDQLEDEVKKYEPHIHINHSHNENVNATHIGEWGQPNTNENIPPATYYNRSQQIITENNNNNHIVNAYTFNTAQPNVTNGNVYSNRWYEPLDGVEKAGHNREQLDNINHFRGKTPINFPTPASTSLHSSMTSIKDDYSTRNLSYPMDNHSTTIEHNFHEEHDNRKVIQSIPYFQSNSQNDYEVSANIDALKDKGKRKRTARKRLTEVQKLAHNKIEKKYRININTKIAQLQKMIPWVSDGEIAFEVHSGIKHQGGNVPGEQVNTKTKFNKSIILQKAIDYIVYLRNNEHLYQIELQRLRNEIESLKQKSNLR